MPNPPLLDWIIQNFFEVPPLLNDHQTEQTRVANPLLNWLRNVALLVEKKMASLKRNRCIVIATCVIGR
jgi:hypothetical protein